MLGQIPRLGKGKTGEILQGPEVLRRQTGAPEKLSVKGTVFIHVGKDLFEMVELIKLNIPSAQGLRKGFFAREMPILGVGFMGLPDFVMKPVFYIDGFHGSLPYLK
jgi:hypothetical protein